jgi:hypothetical protein
MVICWATVRICIIREYSNIRKHDALWHHKILGFTAQKSWDSLQSIAIHSTTLWCESLTDQFRVLIINKIDQNLFADNVQLLSKFNLASIS